MRTLPLYFLVALSCSSAVATAPKVGNYFEVHGHRGARGMRPENTLAAFQYALEAGVTALELDLGVTSDRELVINHDTFVNTDLCSSKTIATKKPLLKNLTLAQVKTYDCGSIRNPEFPQQVLDPGARIPTFRELLKSLESQPLPHARKVKLNVETKYADGEVGVSPEEFVEMIHDVVRDTGFAPERIILQSFDYRTITYAKRKWPQLKTSALVGGRESLGARRIEEIVQQTGVDYLSPHERAMRKDTVAAAHRLGKKLLVYTVNKRDHWRSLAKKGVDGVISDYPKDVIQDLFP